MTLEDFMRQAYALELEAVERYTTSPTRWRCTTTARSRRCSAPWPATRPSTRRRSWPRWAGPSPRRRRGRFGWEGFESPEAVPIDDVHYLMQPWHALQLALAAEQRARSLFGALAASATQDSVRQAALGMQAEEHEHVELVRAWMAKVPHPEPDWDTDPDPPRYTD